MIRGIHHKKRSKDIYGVSLCTIAPRHMLAIHCTAATDGPGVLLVHHRTFILSVVRGSGVQGAALQNSKQVQPCKSNLPLGVAHHRALVVYSVYLCVLGVHGEGNQHAYYKHWQSVCLSTHLGTNLPVL